MSRMNAQIDITAKNKTQKAFDSVNRNLTSLRKSTSQTIARTAKIGTAFAAAAAGASLAIVKMRMSAIDNLAKTADKLGVTTEALSGLQHAAELTGVSTETMNMALQRMTRRVAEAAVGTGEAKGALEELGINALELSKLPLDVQMNVIADAMQGVEKQSDRVRLAMKLFDSEGVALVNTLGGGSEALKQMASEAQLLGIAISRVDAAQIEAANDSVTRAKGVFEGLSNQVAVALSPVITELAANFYQTALDTNELGSVGDRVAKMMVKGFGFVSDGILGLKLLIKGVQLVFARLSEGLLNGFAAIGKAADAIIDQYNKIAAFFGQPTLAANVSKNFKMMADSFGMIGDQIQTEISDALNSPLPSEKIMEWFDNVQMKARETAEVVAANAPAVVADQATPPAAVTEVDPVSQAKMEGQRKLAEFTKKSQMEQTQIVLGELGTQLTGIAKHNKAAFKLQQGVQIAQAIMNTYTGATKALASFPPPINYIMAAAVVASGMAQVAQIRSQSFEGGGYTGAGARAGGVDGKGGFHAILHPNETVIDHEKNKNNRTNLLKANEALQKQAKEREIASSIGMAKDMAIQVFSESMRQFSNVEAPSFQGGGFTGYGSRSGGIDGKGGYPAILHPNESVIDHTKNSGQNEVTVVQNINITTGVQQTVRAEILNLMPDITNATKQAVAESRMRGGAYSKMMVGA